MRSTGSCWRDWWAVPASTTFGICRRSIDSASRSPLRPSGLGRQMGQQFDRFETRATRDVAHNCSLCSSPPDSRSTTLASSCWMKMQDCRPQRFCSATHDAKVTFKPYGFQPYSISTEGHPERPCFGQSCYQSERHNLTKQSTHLPVCAVF